MHAAGSEDTVHESCCHLGCKFLGRSDERVRIQYVCRWPGNYVHSTSMAVWHHIHKVFPGQNRWYCIFIIDIYP
jgi:hypothetical protein